LQFVMAGSSPVMTIAGVEASRAIPNSRFNFQTATLKFAQAHSLSRRARVALFVSPLKKMRGMERREAQMSWFASGIRLRGGRWSGSASPCGAPFAAILGERTVLPGQDERGAL
jgi:hypothetical protein